MNSRLVLALALAAFPAAADETSKNFLADALAVVELGEPVRSDQIILIPLLLKEKPKDAPAVVADRATPKLSFEEPAWPERRFNVDVRNDDDRPVLLFGGGVLVGGKLDRMVPRDLLVPSGATVEVRMLPAEYMQRYRSKPAPFTQHGTLAPAYLRERAIRSPSRNLVPTFVSHFLEFRAKGDDRLSLAAVDESPALAKYCASCQVALATFPDIGGKRVVGYVTAVRGRVHSVELFGSNALLRTYFEPLIRAHAYAAAAIALRAKRVGFPLPDSGAEALDKARGMAAKLLERLQGKASYRPGKLPADTAGEVLLLRAGGTNGYGIGHEGRLVHATVFPYDPFEGRLYAKRLRPPPEPKDPDDPEREDDDPTLGELSRREAAGIPLTPYEQRLLERLKRRRDR